MMYRYVLLICLFCVGCGTALPPTSNVQVVTALPTVKTSPTITPQEIHYIESESCSITGDMPQLTEYVPTSVDWITIQNSQLMANNAPFSIYGVNYYPRLTPFDLFLTESETDVIAKELDVIVPSGINTLRIFVSLEQLFSCESQAVPNIESFTLLEDMIHVFAQKRLHLIIVLFSDIRNPSPSSWDQLQYFVSRYGDEPAIIAWDVLDKGDRLYDALSSEVVLTWLANAILAIRQVDDKHLITASWETNTNDTEPLVDIVSFQHFGDYLPLRQEIANLKATTNKPIVLSAIGYSTFDVDETAQRNLIFQGIEEVRNNNLAGWSIYMAFDYPTSVTCVAPDCPAKPASINFYGIWNTSYFPKLAVDAVKRVTESE